MLQLLGVFAMSLIVLLPVAIPLAVTLVHTIIGKLKNAPRIGAADRARIRGLQPAV